MPLDGAIIRAEITRWLRPADAMKLYEVAYFSDGDILEIGTYHGLSTSILGKAVEASGGKKHITSMDLDSHSIGEAQKNIAATSRFHTLILGDAVQICEDLILQRKVYSFAFIDHSHAYHQVKQACEDLKSLLKPKWICAFSRLQRRTKPSRAFGGRLRSLSSRC